MITEAQAATLAGLPGLLGQVQGCIVCELTAGHQGTHVAFLVASHEGDRPWWMQWSHQYSNVITLDMCNHDSNEPDQDPCLLPLDHAGPHSFDLATGQAHDTRTHP